MENYEANTAFVYELMADIYGMEKCDVTMKSYIEMILEFPVNTIPLIIVLRKCLYKIYIKLFPTNTLVLLSKHVLNIEKLIWTS